MKGWNSFSLKTRWANDNRGWVVVKCNDDVIYVKEGAPTNRPDFCFITNECQPGKIMNPKRLQFAIGPVMKGFGPEWKKYSKPSPFTDFSDPIKMEIRNLFITKGVQLYGPKEKTLVAELQTHLVELGCDPGPVDGQMGNKTRLAALSCRNFADGELPETVDFQTLPGVLTAYRGRFPLQQ
uniref:peptidoglycan-binding domain-containing protein n=1 Tax=Pararhizobium sp. IMCC3301 TaxID=3067904 RepID=UPI0027415AA3|nr:peptidoglycan-binding domain-containing protein [Pararhizobium sp. IMCC3301]